MEVLGEIKDQAPGPSARVHGDGYVIVHYPRYMKRVGDYALQLSPQEMEGLMRSLIDQRKFWSSAKRRPVGVNMTPHEVIVGGREVAGLARGPAYQVFGSDGSDLPGLC